MKRVLQTILVGALVLELAANPAYVAGKNDGEHGKKADPTPAVTQSGQDSGDNKHPSGKDRSEEHGKSGTQGKSGSDPDGVENANGGQPQDKIGNTGGFDKADQDGNNGCGNDDDFEDDNNGRCLGNDPKKLAIVVITPTATPRPTVTPTAIPTVTPTVAPTAVPTAVPTATPTPTSNPQVLGATLPNTGIIEVQMGWMFRVFGLIIANLAFIFPPKKWIANAEW